MNTDELQTISIEAHGQKFSATISDGSTWRESLDVYIKLLGAIGYYISAEKLEDWADNTDAVRE